MQGIATAQLNQVKLLVYTKTKYQINLNYMNVKRIKPLELSVERIKCPIYGEKERTGIPDQKICRLS